MCPSEAADTKNLRRVKLSVQLIKFIFLRHCWKKCHFKIYFLQGFMRSEMHAMHLKTQPNSVCQKLEQFNGKDMICAQGYAPRFDSACNVSTSFE